MGRNRANHLVRLLCSMPGNRKQYFLQRPKTHSRDAALGDAHGSSKNKLRLWQFQVLLKEPVASKFHPHERLVDNPIHRKNV